jgi:RNA-directed DNA polymerase
MSTQVGALSRQPTAWQEINWPACYKTVERLQARIVKATQERKMGKIKALQWVLTRSFSAKAIAVRRVTENRGRKTPGVDGQTWSTPQEKSQAITRLRRRGYHPIPVRRIYIPKTNGSKRPLGIPTIQDRAMQALYLLSLEPVAETMADKASYGFRTKRSTADAIENCFHKLARQNTAQWIMEGDIQACFDHIDHRWLINHVPMDRQILGKWLKSGYMEQGQYKATIQGTPQGGIISPVLANIALDGLEEQLKSYKPLQGKKVNLVRYADDFIITGASPKILVEIVYPLVASFLQERGLSLSANKTKIVHIEEGFDFLGQNIRKYGQKLLIKPSKESCKSLLRQVKAILKKNGNISCCYDLVTKLNPLLRGWGYYHRHIVSKAVFTRMDHLINHQIWRWCARRHPNKSKRWIKRKYFEKGSKFGPFTEGDKSGDKLRKAELEKLESIPIIRHGKIKGAANPYCPSWKTYFEERQEGAWEKHPKYQEFILKIWRKQGGRCPICQQLIETTQQWDKHHIKPKKEGGEEKMENLMLLHPTCHRQLHSNAKMAHSIKTKVGC